MTAAAKSFLWKLGIHNSLFTFLRSEQPFADPDPKTTDPDPATADLDALHCNTDGDNGGALWVCWVLLFFYFKRSDMLRFPWSSLFGPKLAEQSNWCKQPQSVVCKMEKEENF